MRVSVFADYRQHTMPCSIAGEAKGNPSLGLHWRLISAIALFGVEGGYHGALPRTRTGHKQQDQAHIRSGVFSPVEHGAFTPALRVYNGAMAFSYKLTIDHELLRRLCAKPYRTEMDTHGQTIPPGERFGYGRELAVPRTVRLRGESSRPNAGMV